MSLTKLWQKMKSHTIAESVISPACCKIVNIVFGGACNKEVWKIPVPDNVIGRLIKT
jgi:hypothetical protein